MIGRARPLAFGLLVLGVQVPLVAQAQTADAPKPDPAHYGAQPPLPEVDPAIVILPHPQLDAPSSSRRLLLARTIDRIGPQAVSEVLNRAPGVMVQRNNGIENLPAIRSPVLTGGASAGSFLALEDGVPIRAPGFQNVNQLSELALELADRVTILSGPGQLDRNGNALHGSVEAAGPFGQALRELSLTLGGFGRVSLQGEAPLMDAPKSPVLAAFSLAHEPGWRDDSGLDTFRWRLAGEHKTGALTLRAGLAGFDLQQETAGFIEGREAYADRARARANPVPEAYRDTRGVRAHVSAETDQWTLIGFARALDADLNLSFFPSRAQEITRQHGAGLIAQRGWSLDHGWALETGLDLDLSRASLLEVQTRPTIGTFTQGLHYDYVVDMAASGVFGELIWNDPKGAWRADVGARIEGARYAYDDRSGGGDVGRFRRPDDRTDQFGYGIGKAELRHYFRQPGAESIRLTLASGARAPQITDLYSLQPTQLPGQQGRERLTSIEWGLDRVFVAGLELAAVAFHMDKSDVSFRDADGLTVTGAATRHQGLELSLSGLIGSGDLGDLYLLASGSWARHTYRFARPSARAGESISFGARMDGAPRTNGFLALTWDVPARQLGEVLVQPGAELSLTHVGDYPQDAANTRLYRGHQVVDLRLWADVYLRQELRIGLTIRNLFDTAYAERADFAFGNDRYFPGEPRSLSLSLRVSG